MTNDSTKVDGHCDTCRKWKAPANPGLDETVFAIKNNGSIFVLNVNEGRYR